MGTEITKGDLENGFRVGQFVAEPQLQRIQSTEFEVRVEPKVMEVLVLLAENQNKMVSKERFMDEVWAGSIVTGDALLRCISELRKIFNDDPRTPQYIETIRKKGYRLIAPVSPHRDESLPSEPERNVGSKEKEEPVEEKETHSINHEKAPSAKPVSRKNSPYVIGSILSVLILLVVLIGMLFRVNSNGSATPLQALPITVLAGEESDPNLSPDGKRVAFVWNQGDEGNFDIYVKQIGVESMVRLTNHDGEDRSPTWSPDGQYIAFVRSTDEEVTVLIIPSGGGAERVIARFDQREVISVAWSPAGRQLAISAQLQAHGPFAIQLIDVQTLNERLMTQPLEDYRGDTHLAFSPDGEVLAFVRSMVEKAEDIFTVGVASGELKRITNENSEITGLEWTTDGKNIIYTSDRLGYSALWQVSATGGKSHWIPTSGEGSGVHQPSIARSGNRLAFVQRYQETNIWEVSLQAGAVPERRPLISSTRWDAYPSFSPEGQKIAFASNRSGNYEIWVADRDGSGLLQISNLLGPFTNTPRWSPDGRRIAFVAHERGSADIFITGIDLSDPKRFTTSEANDRAPSWSRDGWWIYFASNRTGAWEIWKKSVIEGDLVQMSTGGGFAAMESPDSLYLYFVKRLVPGIWRMPLDGGPEELIVPDLEPYDWGNWTVTDLGIYYLSRRSTGSVLVFHDFHTAQRNEVAFLSRIPRYPALTLSPDQNCLLFTRIDRIDSDILLVEQFR